jgi:uncharacterized protein (UPF0276 family)
MVAGATSGTAAPGPSIGIGYRHGIDDWIRANLARFDVLEITLDHCLAANGSARDAIFDLVGQIPLTAHGIGLSIGTDIPLDLAYLDAVAALLDRLGAPAYSEHLAFTRVPGRDLGNLLPLPRTHAVAESIIANVKTVQSRISVPFLLENITYIFDWPDSELIDAEFLTLICRETGAGLLLDLENLYLNASNHDFDAGTFLEALPTGLVREIHLAGGKVVSEDFLRRPLLVDTHSYPVPEEALALLDRTLVRQAPATIVLERDDRLDAVDEILNDLVAIRARVGAGLGPPTPPRRGEMGRRPLLGVTESSMRNPLIERQASLLEHLTGGGAIFGEDNLSVSCFGIDRGLLHLEAKFSHQKRMEKIKAVLPRTLDHMGSRREAIVRDFADACPPTGIGRLESARQFHAFLLARWREEAPEPPYLPDVAAFEIAYAAVQTMPNEGSQSAPAAPPGAVRRHPAVVLLRSVYDIRPILEEESTEAAPERRQTCLAFAMPGDSARPVVQTLLPELFALLDLLDHFAPREVFDDMPDADSIIDDLAASGLVEVRR